MASFSVAVTLLYNTTAPPSPPEKKKNTQQKKITKKRKNTCPHTHTHARAHTQTHARYMHTRCAYTGTRNHANLHATVSFPPLLPLPIIDMIFRLPMLKAKHKSQRSVSFHLPHLHTPFLPFSPSLISLMVSVDVKHHVYSLPSFQGL